MPRASVSTATAVKTGFFSSWRKTRRRSFIGNRQLSGKAPNPRCEFPMANAQAPKKSQFPNPNPPCQLAVLELGNWRFFGIWSLVIGHSFPGASLEFGAWWLELLFVSQRFHGIRAHRASRGQPRGEQGHTQEKQGD